MLPKNVLNKFFLQNYAYYFILLVLKQALTSDLAITTIRWNLDWQLNNKYKLSYLYI